MLKAELPSLSEQAHHVERMLVEFLRSQASEDTTRNESSSQKRVCVRNARFSCETELQAAVGAVDAHIRVQRLLSPASLQFLDDNAEVRTVVRVFTPPEFPHSPFHLYIDRCGDPAWLRHQLTFVCPEMADWQGSSRPVQSGPLAGLLSTQYYESLSGVWCPRKSLSRVVNTLFTRLRGKSFPELVPGLLTRVGSIPRPKEHGTMTILAGTAGEAPPVPAASERVVLLLDPHWTTSCTPDMLYETGALDGFVHWIRGQTLYLAVSAPYCSANALTQQCMESMLLRLREAGWTQLQCQVRGGVDVRLPLVEWEVSYDETENCSWAGVPGVLRRSSPGVTIWSYMQAPGSPRAGQLQNRWDM